jgi:hypothetical protein
MRRSGKPLTALTKKDTKSVFAEAQENVIQKLKDKISSDKVLEYPSIGPRHEYRLHTDASDEGVSVVLA